MTRLGSLAATDSPGRAVVIVGSISGISRLVAVLIYEAVRPEAPQDSMYQP